MKCDTNISWIIFPYSSTIRQEKDFQREGKTGESLANGLSNYSSTPNPASGQLTANEPPITVRRGPTPSVEEKRALSQPPVGTNHRALGSGTLWQMGWRKGITTRGAQEGSLA